MLRNQVYVEQRESRRQLAQLQNLHRRALNRRAILTQLQPLLSRKGGPRVRLTAKQRGSVLVKNQFKRFSPDRPRLQSRSPRQTVRRALLLAVKREINNKKRVVRTYVLARSTHFLRRLRHLRLRRGTTTVPVSRTGGASLAHAARMAYNLRNRYTRPENLPVVYSKKRPKNKPLP